MVGAGGWGQEYLVKYALGKFCRHCENGAGKATGPCLTTVEISVAPTAIVREGEWSEHSKAGKAT